METIVDTIDQISYEIGETSGYIDGSKVGYEYGYHDCVLDLIKKSNRIKRQKARKAKRRLYFMKQKLWGVALLLLTFYVCYLADGDCTVGVITVPMALILIFGKGRWIL